MTPEEKRLRAQVAAHESWAKTPDRAARTDAARRAFEQKFLTEAGGDPARAEHLRKAHFARLALASVRNRRLAAAAVDDAFDADTALTAAIGPNGERLDSLGERPPHSTGPVPPV